MTDNPETIFRYSYESRRDGLRYVARVTIYRRDENDGFVLLLLRPVGRWPDREDLAELADACDEKDVPMVSGIMLTVENEEKWRTENLRAENEEWVT